MKYTTGWAATTKMGPNDARRVIWTLGEYFLFFSSLFLILTKVLLYLHDLMMKYETGWAGTTKKGLNDARRVVGALG